MIFSKSVLTVIEERMRRKEFIKLAICGFLEQNLRLVTVKKSGDSFKIIERHPYLSLLEKKNTTAQ